ncbi:serine hydrolase domain-containing protein [Amycolatopsis anabasis]|uniref:serine hydrolase domain-containing protein n=1 Tax=Amycolatopsis anabasis TaxID=1840409 RepID=UPI001C552D5B|nr:serine hydrolase domain-containing protein [Amycolatopsis anabasis]
MARHQPSRRSVLALLGTAPLAASTVLSASGTAHSDASQFDQVSKDLRPGGKFDNFITQWAADGKFAGTVLLNHRGRTVLSRSHGMANRRSAVPNGPDTIFNLASVGKLFTAIAIAQLAEQGKVAYHEKLGAYLDGFPAEIADNVTVHHLLTHTSGMGDFMRMDGFDEEAKTWDSVEKTWNGIMSSVRRTGKLPFLPGAGSIYSNSGYFTLGAIVAKAANSCYYDYIRERVFQTANMRDADFYTKPQWRDNRRIARPYVRRSSGEQVDVVDEHHFVGSPAGSPFATAADLANFARTLQGGKLIGELHTQLTLSPKLPIPPDASAPGEPLQPRFATYAGGVTLADDQWIHGHKGGAPGVSASVQWFPATDWTSVTLSNYDDGSTEPINALARKLISEHRPRT